MSLSAVAFASMNPFIFLFTAIAACIFVWGKGKADELTRLKEKFKPVDDAIKYAEEVKSDARKTESEARREAQKNLKSDTTQAESIISDAAKEAKKIKTEVYNLKGTLSQHKHELRIVDDALALRSDEAHLLEVGYYEQHMNLKT